jgi:hypothetical protein
MIQVQVLVAIDAKGKIVKVTPVGPIADVRLVAAATKSAQLWEFEPAQPEWTGHRQRDDIDFPLLSAQYGTRSV